MEDDLRPSKTQRKKAMHDLQELGSELVELNDRRLAQVDLPERLRDAIVAAQAMKGFEARRRQLQYIGKLMRDVDPAPIRARLEAWRDGARRETALLHRAEAWRDRLLDDETSLTLLMTEHPGIDAQQVRMLIRNAARERAENKPPRAYRELYKVIRAALATPDAADEGIQGEAI